MLHSNSSSLIRNTGFGPYTYTVLKVRGFLQIPSATSAVLERYSDSAATFVVLDPNNVSVYKQLFRAAKAKQKLKLRVTTKTEEPKAEQEPREASGPKPATVEDEPEAPVVGKQEEPDTTVEPMVPQLTSEYSTPAPASTEATAPDTIVAPQVADDFPDFIKEWRARGMPSIHLRRNDSGVEIIEFGGPATAANPMVTLEPLLEGSSVSLDKTLSSDRHQYRFSRAASTLSFTKLIQQAQTADANDEAKAEDEEFKAPNSTPAALSAPEPVPASSQESIPELARPRPFTVCCNSCDKAVPNAHYHCSSCDDGDFDLCVDCVDRGITCYDDGHWLIKRTIENGLLTYSTTQVVPRSSRSPTNSEKMPDAEPKPLQEPCMAACERSLKSPLAPPAAEKVVRCWDTIFARTCNSCVQEYPEHDFLHCNACEDYDLCQTCFTHDQHGHHPSHSFSPAVKGTVFSQAVSSRLPAGRNVPHNAICDGCDKYVHGVRHKCLECPDWDYCSECVENANFIHPNHRFVALFEPIVERTSVSRAVHSGICCDGPLCKNNSKPSYIVGERYKCAVCNDLDFCANCEASPANLHNKTHPLIKFQTPVRHVSVTTTGEHMDGQFLPTMGDRSNERTGERLPYRNDQGHQRNREMRRQLLARARHMASEASLSSRSGPKEEPAASSLDGIAVNTMRTVVDVEPTEAQEVKAEETAVEADQVTLVEEKEPEMEQVPDLVAIFKHDTVEDGTMMPPNHTFEQTWVLRNEGNMPWPAGCTVKFVGGDYMGAVDPTHPAGIHELVSASESTVCYNQLKPGQEFPFTVLMRTPDREGKVISYWRLTTADGVKFGHKLWCDVTVQSPSPKALDETTPEIVKSQMIIPKLDHESPASSLHVFESKEEPEEDKNAGQYAPSADGNEDDFEDCGEDESWAEQSDDGFMTDEEYDILDASDEEYLFEQQKGVAKK